MRFRKPPVAPAPRFPGLPAVADGSDAVLRVEAAASDAAAPRAAGPGIPIGAGWAAAAAAGRLNARGRGLISLPAASDAAAAASTAGLSMAGLRAVGFTSGEALAAMHEALYAAAGKRLTFVLHVACRAVARQAQAVSAGHDDYHAVDDTGVFQLLARDVQEAADLALIAHRIAELGLTPGICAQDAGLTSRTLESLRLPEPELIREFLGDPADPIEAPTPAQRLVFGERRRRIPEMVDLDYPAMLGVVQGPDSYEQGVAAQRPFYLDHLADLADRAFQEFAALTGRRYGRAAAHRAEDAEYAIVAQGAACGDAEVVADHLRASRGLRIGVVSVTMFRPFPADLLARLLRGKRAVLVLERADQPLAADPPLLREIRATMSKAVENGRAGRGGLPHPAVAACEPDAVPDFYAGCFGLGGRPLGPGDLVAAVNAMLDGGHRRRHFYLGIDFVRRGTRLPKLQIWQESLLDGYPGIADLALPPVGGIEPRPEGALTVRIHARGGDARSLTRDLAVAAEALGLHAQAVPADATAMTGQPTAAVVTLAREPVRASAESRTAEIVLALDPSALPAVRPLEGLADEGALVIASDRGGADLWDRLPPAVRRDVRARRARLFAVDASGIAAQTRPAAPVEARDTALLGALFRLAPLGGGGPARDAGALLRALGDQPDDQRDGQEDGWSGAGAETRRRALERGFEEIQQVDHAALAAPAGEAIPEQPPLLDAPQARPGLGHPGRFWEQVGFLHRTGQDGLADPVAATGTLPPLTSTIQDLSALRTEIPELVPGRCTGCGQCWTQCPDTAIRGLVSSVEDLLRAAIARHATGRAADRLSPVVRSLGAETRRCLSEAPEAGVPDAIAVAYGRVADRLDYEPERRAALDAEFARVHASLIDFPLARPTVFFDGTAADGGGGLLSVTLDPDACKGCGLCVEVCPEGALRPVEQDGPALERLRRSWRLWQLLPETDDRVVERAGGDSRVGLLPALLLKKAHAGSMAGGDGACPGCGEKTGLHLVLSAIRAALRPRVAAYLARLDDLVARLDQKARGLLASDVDLEVLDGEPAGRVDIPLDAAKHAEVARLSRLVGQLKDLRWRYAEGPGGRGRADCAVANAAGCSSLWASRYPHNPYPFPWTAHLRHEAPAVALALFEGQMRKMAEGFVAVRRAELELAGEYEAAVHDPELAALDWRGFTDEEFALCPPILAVGGDGALLDAGLDGLSGVLASGRPVRIVMLDTQGGSSTGGEASTAGFAGQAPRATRPGADAAVKGEPRKEPVLLALAHRDAFVVQSSPAFPAHLAAGVLAALRSRRPALLVLHAACPREHGIAAAAATRAARLAVESRAVPLVVYDPAAGPSLGHRLSLDGNPDPDRSWVVREIRHVDETGAERSLRAPLTVADWALTEERFRHQFSAIGPESAERTPVPLDEYLELAPEERAGRQPFVHALDPDGRLTRLAVADGLVRLAEDRLALWRLLREMAGLRQPDAATLETAFEQREAALRGAYEARLAELRTRYSHAIARRLAEVILRGSQGAPGLGELLRSADGQRGPASPGGGGDTLAFATAPAAAPAPARAAAAPVAPGPAPVAVASNEPLTMEPSIDSALCTACNECTNLNKRMFAYNAKKQAYIKDPRAGTFRELVLAAEKCPVRIIHPGTPLNRAEKDLDQWIARAKPFN
jgi:pyruvate-ferredoxin/flavodoxin oxidoreductase